MEGWIKKSEEKKTPEPAPSEVPARNFSVMDEDNEGGYYPELDGIDLTNYELPPDAFPEDDPEDDFGMPAMMAPAPPASRQAQQARRVVKAPLMVDPSNRSSWSPEIRIKAQVAKNGKSCVFFVDRPVLEGYSAWYADAASAPGSPLAERLFAECSAVNSVLLHEFTLTVTTPWAGSAKEWEPIARQVGAVVREHLLSGLPVVPDFFCETMPPEESIRVSLQNVIDTEINPGVAGHGGVITLNGVHGNSVAITMGGGCQGCSAASLTLREGIFNAFRKAVPQLGAILDETDHASGRNPFYSEPIPGIE